jgi:hypothetical protein
MVVTPSDVTVHTILKAKKKELEFWVKQANVNAHSRVLTLKGTVQTLREKLANYYGLDLNVSAHASSLGPNATCTDTAKSETVIIGLVLMDLRLRQTQWAFLRQLGEEWEEKTASGLPFTLVRDERPGQGPAVAVTHASDKIEVRSPVPLARPHERSCARHGRASTAAVSHWLHPPLAPRRLHLLRRPPPASLPKPTSFKHARMT